MKCRGIAILTCCMLAMPIWAQRGPTPQAPEGWQVPQAPLRFNFRIDKQPSHPSAGYFVEIPDGGLLPDRALTTHALTPAGKPLQSFVLWHNPNGNLGIVVEHAPNDRSFTVYVEPTRQYGLWTRDSGLTPSAILVTDPTQASLEAAAALARLGRVGPRIHFRNKAGVRRAPLSIGGDETGRPRPASFYHLVHVVSRDPGRTWVAPFILEGDARVRINGQALTPHERIDKWGGTGDWADIRPGPNMLEVFLSVPGHTPFYERTQGLLYLTWRTPNATMEDLGGIRSEALPMAGTSRMETRIIREAEVMQSGRCTLSGVAAQNDTPIGLIQHPAPKIFWVGNEQPLLVYQFEAQIPDNRAADTTFTWGLPDGTSFSGRRMQWILPALQEYNIQLQTLSPSATVIQDYNFFGFSTRKTSLNDSNDRRDFRTAFQNMAETLPTDHPQATSWPDALWRNLIRTIEPGQDAGLLIALFRNHSALMAQKLAPGEIYALQDLLLESLARQDTDEALAWIRHFGRTTQDQPRRDALTLRLADIHIHYRGNLDDAEEILRTMERPGLDDTQRFVRIRLGDLALKRGDLNLATRYYAEVQNHARMERTTAGARLLQDSGRPLLGATAESGLSRDWRMRALIETSASESVRSLLDQGYLWEAREMLYEWERNLPISKISGDFLILESRLYAHMQDPARAVSMLLAFCQTVEGSSHLAEATPLLLRQMQAAAFPPEEIKTIGMRLHERLAFHPVAQEIKQILDSP